jgi:hypothetical protein
MSKWKYLRKKSPRRLRRPKGPKKLDRLSAWNHTKAGLIACFFLLAVEGRSADNLWRFDEELERIHLLVLNLQTDQAYAALAKIKTNEYHRIYVQSLCETLDALISEDEKRFEDIEDKFRAYSSRLS